MLNNNKQIDQLLELSEKLSEKINIDIKLVEKLNDEMLKNVPEEQKGEIEKMVAIKNKALILAKEGKQEEAINIIKEMQNECKRK